jgi:hypothetical protein
MPDEHQGLPVEGYRPQSMATIDRVNANKRHEEEILRVIDAFEHNPNIDPRWLSIARTHIEQGFMALNRAIFQPARVKLPGDPT